MKNEQYLVKYLPITKFFHWAIAYLVLILLPLGFFMRGLNTFIQANAYLIHKSLGITVLILMILRIAFIIFIKRPPLPVNMLGWERYLSKLVQYSLYVFLIIMPISGWIMSTAANKIPLYFGLFYVPFPGISPNKILAEYMIQVHSTTAWILLVLIFLHLSGALKHYFINKDEVFQSML